MQITDRKALYRYLDQISGGQSSDPETRGTSHEAEDTRDLDYRYLDQDDREWNSITKSTRNIGIWIKNPSQPPWERQKRSLIPLAFSKMPIPKRRFRRRSTENLGQMPFPREKQAYRYLDQAVIGIWIKFQSLLSVLGSKNIGIWIKLLSVFGSSQNGQKCSPDRHFASRTINVLIYIITLTLTQRSFKNIWDPTYSKTLGSNYSKTSAKKECDSFL